jgi:hypothetical protein
MAVGASRQARRCGEIYILPGKMKNGYWRQFIRIRRSNKTARSLKAKGVPTNEKVSITAEDSSLLSRSHSLIALDDSGEITSV